MFVSSPQSSPSVSAEQQYSTHCGHSQLDTLIYTFLMLYISELFLSADMILTVRTSVV